MEPRKTLKTCQYYATRHRTLNQKVKGKKSQPQSEHHEVKMFVFQSKHTHTHIATITITITSKYINAKSKKIEKRSLLLNSFVADKWPQLK